MIKKYLTDLFGCNLVHGGVLFVFEMCAAESTIEHQLLLRGGARADQEGGENQ